MQGFTYHVPTEVVFGAQAEDQLGDLIKKRGASRVLLVYGEGSVVKSGLLDKLCGILTATGIEYRKHGGATPNPHLSFARDGVKAALDFKADLILAVGGGSAIDAAKGIAHGAKNPDIDIWKFWTREEIVTKSLPIGVVLTISAAGSETSNSAVLTNTETGKKRGLATEFNRPAFAVLNPELTFSLPKYQIACGIADIMMHTMERYFVAPDVPGADMTDEIAEGLLRTVIKNGLVAMENPHDYHAMSELMWCGSLSHNSITGLGRPMDFSVHQMGHELSGRFDVAHGASLTTMWGSWARYCLDVNPARFVQYANKIWGAKTDVEGIERTESYFRSIGMPTCFTELGIGVQDDTALDEMADSCVFYGQRQVGTFKTLVKENIYEIYKSANR